MFDRGVVHIVVAVYIVAHYCLMFNRGVVYIVVAVIFLPNSVMGNNINSHNNINHSSVKH
jgi:hypothetical protein